MCRCVSVVAGAVMIDERDRVIPGKRVESVIFNIREQSARQSNGAERRISHAVIGVDSTDFVIQKTHIEMRVVRHQHRIADKI